jgi:hypothetical protein
MAGTTITTVSLLGLTVSGTAQMAVSIAATGALEPAAGPAIYANASQWSLFNQGDVVAGAGAVGIYVVSGTASLANQGYIGGLSGIVGNIILQNTGQIVGRTGAAIDGTGNVVNRGTISGGLGTEQGDSNAIGVELLTGALTNGLIGVVRGGYEGVHFSDAGAVANLGTIEGNDGVGVVLAGGGSVVNGNSTDINALIYGNLGGVSLEAGGVVVNYGRIVTPAGSGSRNGVGLGDGGLVINSGEISGFNGIDAGTGTVENSGQISGGSVLQIAIPFAGYTYVSGAGVVLAGGTLQNTGTVKGGSIPSFLAAHTGTAGAGVTLDSGLIVNSGSISGGAAVGYTLTGGSGVLAITGTLTNSGRISGGAAYYGGDGLMVLSGAYVQNSGTIQGGTGTFGGAGVLLEGGTLQNSGSIAGGDGTSWNWAPGLAAGVDIYTGLFINDGAVTGGAQQHVGIDLGAGTLQNFGTISGATGVLEQSGLIENEGFIEGTGVAVEIWAGTLVNAGTLAGHYAVYMTSAAQKLVADPGAVFQGKVVAKGTAATLELASGTGTLDMGTSFSGFATIALDQGGSWDLAGGITQLAGGEVITGVTQGDMLELEGFTASSATYVSGLGLELSNGASIVTLGITGGFPTHAFTATPDATGTRIAICYARGTRIMTVQGDRPVEALDIGDELPTYFSGTKRVKWIGRQNFTAAELKGDRSRPPVRIKAGALGGGLPRRNLVISPGHSVLIDGVLVLAKYLVNGITVTQDEPMRDVAYYLIEFDGHDCVLAEGVWAESFADGPGLRAHFHNAAEFYRLYPEYKTPGVITLCAPRPEHGPALAAALRPAMALAARVRPGALRGFIERIEARYVEGWAQDFAWPELPQLLRLTAGGRVLGEVLACQYRTDLEQAGIGAGRAHFTFTADKDFPRASLRVCRVADGAELGAHAGLV